MFPHWRPIWGRSPEACATIARLREITYHPEAGSRARERVAEVAIVQDGRLLPAALAAKQRGVIFDIGHGGGSFDYTVAEVAIAQGCPPDTISSDIHVFSGIRRSCPM
jgi:hypothetical protein